MDTWAGDEQTGFYGPDVYERVASHNRRYSGFSTLLRTSFDEAANHFEQESIDLLHIDGLHTYAAVKHDLESWLPKLSEKPVVLFDDTNVRERVDTCCRALSPRVSLGREA